MMVYSMELPEKNCLDMFISGSDRI